MPMGSLVVPHARVDTPKKGTPDQVLEALLGLIKPLGTFDRISVGFPGVVRAGHVVTAPNLGTESWRDYPLAAVLTDRLGKPVRMLNDATVHGLGVIDGNGLECVITLGTGFGFALFDNGRPHAASGTGASSDPQRQGLRPICRRRGAEGDRPQALEQTSGHALTCVRNLTGYDMSVSSAAATRGTSGWRWNRTSVSFRMTPGSPEGSGSGTRSSIRLSPRSDHA